MSGDRQPDDAGLAKDDAGGPRSPFNVSFMWPEPEAAGAQGTTTVPRMGEELLRAGVLDAAQIEHIVKAQRQSGMRFGETAIALGLLTPEQVQLALADQFHFPGLARGAHPLLRRLPLLCDPFGAEAEAVRQVRANILLRMRDIKRFSVAITSPTIHAGKTYMATSLAAAFAQTGRRTLLLNANLRESGQQSLPDLADTPGLSSILAGRARDIRSQPLTGLPLLHVIDAGPQPPNPLELLQEPALRTFLHSVGQEFDVVIVDTPAALESSDAQAIAAQTDVCVMVVRQHKTSLSQLNQCRELLMAAHATLLGVVYGARDAHQSRLKKRWFKWRDWFSRSGKGRSKH
ncbi:polysaccharide biosynthesis tyrosine autokinase [Kerstersia sp.]|uniref:polysaccharide biosynthesis tyrosine autokinase n=1 Tax=Kerstersia sp. TaxID=1930783 RepID=UPI003F8E2D6A